MVRRTVVGAHYGLRDFLAQRITAVLMTIYSVLFAGLLVVHGPASQQDWRALFAPQWMRLATLLFFLSLFWHAWIGMRDIFMDYIKPTGLRLACHVAAIVLLIAYAGWAIQILWSLG
jgi:succinate dehydrogenase / fumarate reductase membrane anchor subunit